MLLSIVILNFNTAPLTIQCIRSIKRHCTIPASDYEIIIVDNHSREEDVEKLTRECQGIPDSQSAHLPGSDALTTAAATPPAYFTHYQQIKHRIRWRKHVGGQSGTRQIHIILEQRCPFDGRLHKTIMRYGGG